MIWKDTKQELPPLHKSFRCIAQIQSNIWTGYCDVFFDPSLGWMRCETELPVKVLKWIFIEEFEND